MLYQQGDVLFELVSNIPVNARVRKNRIIAEGEATGHSHAIIENESEIFEENGTLYLRVPKETTVTHQEHHPLVLPQGDYKIRKVREYDHFSEEARQVRD